MKCRILLFVTILLVSGPALACSCPIRSSIGGHFDRSTYVFTAVVTDVRNIKTPDELMRSGSRYMRTWQSAPRMIEGSIRVTASFKGDAASLAAVYTHPDGPTCGLALSPGEEFLFFADEAGLVQFCGGNVARSSPVWRERVEEVQRYQADGPLPVPSLRDLLAPPDE